MKIVVIKKKIQSQWRSCQSITSNLLKAYQGLEKAEGKSVCSFELSEEPAFDEFQELSQLIQDENITHVAWIDHYPHPMEFLTYLKTLNLKRRPVFLFHIFGDFILHAPMWKSISTHIKSDFQVVFICASYKQAELLGSLSDSDTGIVVVPFPVDGGEFFFDQNLRESGRDSLGLESKQVFLYSGRLSYQKNVLDLIHAFSHYLTISQDDAMLLITGPMDDLGAPYIGKEALAGTFYFHWQECMSVLPEEHQKRVLYLGNVSKEYLREVYCASDYYVSLSCHNDEDYGMAPAEALMCGLPCILSAWGGFSSFKRYCPSGVNLVDVKLGDNRQNPGLSGVAKNLLTARDLSSRSEVLESAKKSVSIEAVQERLHEVINSEEYFESFNEKFYKLSSLFASNPYAPFRSAKGGYNYFYRELYELYCGGLDD